MKRRTGQRYWYISTGPEDCELKVMSCTDTESVEDNERARRGNMFKTEKRCTDAFNAIRKLLRSHRRVRQAETYYYLKSGLADSFLHVQDELDLGLEPDRRRCETHNYSRSFDEMQETREKIAQIFKNNRN